MTPFTVRATRHTPHALRVVSGKGDSFPCSFSLPFSARKNGRDLTLVSLFICPAVQLRVLFARQHASTPHAQSEPDQSTTCTQRQAHAEMMTHHSLQNVLVAGAILLSSQGARQVYRALLSTSVLCLVSLLSCFHGYIVFVHSVGCLLFFLVVNGAVR